MRPPDYVIEDELPASLRSDAIMIEPHTIKGDRIRYGDPMKPDSTISPGTGLENPDNTIPESIRDWGAYNKYELDSVTQHLFMEGANLSDIMRRLIGTASSEIIVVNPFVEGGHISNALIDASKSGCVVKLITREADSKKKIDYHKKMKRSGITIIYNNEVHAKVTLVDREIGIVSSMNLYAHSSGGGVWEAGIVSWDTRLIDKILDSGPFSDV
ncbi:MAG: phospholipase D-like domain-containing protein [Candidatus Thorarchaeota archaeon]